MHAWAEAVGYSLGKSTGRLDRDGGLSVIVSEVPLLTQDQLNILTPDEWQQRKPEFVYSSWVARALQEVQRTR